MALHFLMPISMAVEQIRAFPQYLRIKPDRGTFRFGRTERATTLSPLQCGTDKTRRTFGDTTGLFAHVTLLSRSGRKWRTFTPGIAERWNLTSKILMPCAIT